MRLRHAVPGLVLLALLSACGRSSSGSQPTTGPTTSSTPTATEQQQPWASLGGDLDRCGLEPRDVAAAQFHYRLLHDRRIGRLPSVAAGHGRTVAVLLHQTDGNGFCGWLPFAARIAADPSLAVLAVDLCGYGDAHCRPGVSASDAAAYAVHVARHDLHAARVVLVGASMGGSEALITVTRDVPVQAAVDLSGPVEWDGMEAVRAGRALRVPVLVSMADSEGVAEVRVARQIVAQAPAGSRFVAAGSGHGYELLLDSAGEPGPLAAALLDWIRSFRS